MRFEEWQATRRLVVGFDCGDGCGPQNVFQYKHGVFITVCDDGMFLLILGNTVYRDHELRPLEDKLYDEYCHLSF